MQLLSLCISADPLVGSIAAQYVSNREEHDKTAREWTRRYATWMKIETYWSLFITVNSWDVRSETPQDLNELILQRTGLNCMLFCDAEEKKIIKIGVWELGTRDSRRILSPVSTRRFSSTSCFVRIRKMNDLVSMTDTMRDKNLNGNWILSLRFIICASRQNARLFNLTPGRRVQITALRIVQIALTILI